jgi:hypothetical protein
MAQTPPIDPINPAAFDVEIANAETAFALSSVTAKILGCLSASSGSAATQLTDPTNGLPAIAMSATQLTDPTNGLPAIAKEIATTICNLANVTIAGRGDSKCPVHVTIGDDQSLRVSFGQQTTDAVRELLCNLSDIAKNTSTIATTISNWPNPTVACADLKHRMNELAKDLCILQEHFTNHHHPHLRSPPTGGYPTKTSEDNNPDRTETSPSSTAE